MKKATGSLKLKNVPRSQPSISSFFAKTIPNKNEISPAKSINESKSSNNGSSKQDSIKTSSIKKPSEIVDLTGENGNIIEKDDSKRKRKLSSENLSEKNAKEVKQKDDYDRKKKQNQWSINKKISNLLLKGKHSENDDHIVPDIFVSPHKKSKISDSDIIINKSAKKTETIKISTHKKGKKSLEIVHNSKSITKNIFNESFKEINKFTDNFKENSSNNSITGNNVDSTVTNCNEYIKKNASSVSPNKINISDVNRGSPNKNDLKLNIDSHHVNQKLDFENCKDGLQDFFIDNWNLEDLHMEKENLDLSSWQRCEVLSVTEESCHTKKTLHLKSLSGDKRVVCILEGYWKDILINKGDVISIVAQKQDSGGFSVSDGYGLVVTQPDVLVSGTAVVGSLFCKRKAVLQDRFRGVDSGNRAMVIGSLVHQLFQIALTKKDIGSGIIPNCLELMEDKSTIYMLYNSNLDKDDILKEVLKYEPQITSFVDRYVKKDQKQSLSSKLDWDGTIDNIVDIEENIWSPHLGIKGKIDVTLEVKIHDKKQRNGPVRRLMPLELKTGRPTVSAEHRGQVILYTMMMEDSPRSLPAHSKGLLLYLKESIGIHEVSAGHSEKRDLILLRNELAHYLSKWTPKDSSKTIKSEQQASEPVSKSENSTLNVRVLPPKELVNSYSEINDFNNLNDDLEKYFTDLLEEEDRPTDLPVMELPDPINHHSACGKCPYLTLCSIYLDGCGVKLSEGHPLSKLRPHALGHLQKHHWSYTLHWASLLALEETDRSVHTPLRDIWTVPPLEREKRGKCITGLKVQTEVKSISDRFLHQFNRAGNTSSVVQKWTLQSGDYVVVSTKERVALAAGSVTGIFDDHIKVLLERDLTKRNTPDTLYCLDIYESQSLVIYNLSNLGLLMDDTETSARLRSIVIDKKIGTFEKKISRSVLDVGKSILKTLNIIQQRAVLKSLAANDYLLIRGMPGTGKTQTIVALVEILYSLGKTILITSQTHSAVDNVLTRLLQRQKETTMKLLRLGSTSRIHRDLLKFSEDFLTDKPEQLITLYEQARVVGVTCLGSAHPLLSQRTFDVCIVDESTQVLQCSVLRPLFASKKFILVGDPDQLPPIVRSNKAKRLGLDESLFQRLCQEECTVSLNLQYRMNGPIMDLANYLTYEGLLQVADASIECQTIAHTVKKSPICQLNNAWLQVCVSPSLENSVILIDTGNTSQLPPVNLVSKIHGVGTNSKEYFNAYEAALIFQIVSELCQLGIEKSAIGVITPYREQVALLRGLMKSEGELEINTVDQFQGRDKSVVLFSCSKSRSTQQNKTLKFIENEILEDHRRLTVAITRAKHKLIIIGDVATLKHYTPFKKLFDGISSERKVRLNHLKGGKSDLEIVAAPKLGCVLFLPDFEMQEKFSWSSLIKNISV